MSLDFTIAFGSVLVFIPAVLSVWLTHKGNQQTRTNHGKTIGEHVEKLVADLEKHGDDLNDLTRWSYRHTADDAERFGEVLHLLKDQNKAATIIKQDLHDQAAEIKLTLARWDAISLTPIPVTIDTPLPVVVQDQPKDNS